MVILSPEASTEDHLEGTDERHYLGGSCAAVGVEHLGFAAVAL